MELKKLDYDLTVCKVASIDDIDLKTDFFFIQGILDFSLIGILSKLSNILAENEIGIFAVSTYNTDYILVKKENFHKAMDVLATAGYTLV